jgi:erythronate-4-phosphate dehydrogenase
MASRPGGKGGRLKIVADINTPLIGPAFRGVGDLTLVETGSFTPAVLRGADVLVVRSETRVDESLLAGSGVSFVGTVTIGTDHIDTAYLASQGIAFASAPGSNANSVKEYVLAAMLAVGRRAGFTLRGATIGIVGVGNIGSRVAAMAEGLGMHVLLNDPPLARETADPKYLPLDALMKADILTLHVPLTRSGADPTFHLFDARRLGAIRPGALLINTSRGPVVHGESLLQSLRSGRLGGAVLDVWEKEPVVDEPLLRAVALGTPHIAGYSLDGKVNAVVMIRDAVVRHFGGGVSWDPWAEVAPPERPVVTPGAGAPEEQLGTVVHACYDIAADDASLRDTLGLPEADRPAAFSKLRKHYRVRREFRNFVIQAAGPDPAARKTLEAAEFRVLS